MLYVATIMPYRVALVDTDTNAWTSWEYALDIFFGVDVCINCVLAYYDDDMSLVVSHRRILFHYLVTWMIPDLTSAIPFELILSMQNYQNLIRLAKLPRISKLIKLAKLLRMMKIIKNRSRFSRYANSVLRINLSIERLFWFIVWLVLLLHLFACCWIFFAKLNEEEDDNWILCRGYTDYSNLELYIVGVYFSITTLATVGYGDLTACNMTERVVCSVMMLVGIFVYSVTIGSLTNLLANLDKRRAALNQRMEVLIELSDKYHFNKLFFQKLSQALEYEQRNSQKDLNDLFSCLPSNLRTQLLIVIYCKMLEKNVFFEDRTEHFVAWVAPRLTPVRIVEGEYVYHEKQPATEMFFIIRGEVEYVLSYDVRFAAYHVVKTHYYFGEEDLLLSDSKLHQFTTKTAGKCEFLVLTRGDFEDMMGTFEQEAIEILAITEQRKARILEHQSLAEKQLKERSAVTRHISTPVNKSEVHFQVHEFVKKEETDHLSDASSDDELENKREITDLPSADVVLKQESFNSELIVSKTNTMHNIYTKIKNAKKKKQTELKELQKQVTRMEEKFDALSELVVKIGDYLGANAGAAVSPVVSQASERELDAIVEAGVETEEKEKEASFIA